MIRPVKVSNKEFKEFHSLQEREHKGHWHAVFSVNDIPEVWPFVCYGRTPEEMRRYVELHDYPLLGEIVRYFINDVRKEGGRLFFSQEGVFFIEEENEFEEEYESSCVKPLQFIKWIPDESLINSRREDKARIAASIAEYAQRRSIQKQEIVK